MFIRKLVISNLLNRRVRAGLTIAAVALSVSLVVAVTSGYGSVIGAVSKYVESWFGTIDAQIARQHDPHGSVSSRIITGLRADPLVKRADGRIEVVTPLLDASGKSLDTKMATVMGIDRPSDTRIQNLRMHAGQFFDNNNEDVAVIDQALAEQMKL